MLFPARGSHEFRRYLRYGCLPLLGFALLLGSGCSDHDDGTGAGPSPTVKLVQHAQLGTILTDGSGRTLYYFAKDLPGSGSSAAVSNCTGGCADVWPVYHTSTLAVGAGLSRSDFGEITRADGQKQTTYKGWPLYYYFDDSSPGDANGQDVNSVWYVSPDPFYTVMPANDDALGGRLIDATGRSLYYFARDVPAAGSADPTSNCPGGCLDIWPIFHTADVISTTAYDASDFGSFMRSDGQMQTTYKGWPLDYFASDSAPGDHNGEGVNDIWFVATDDIDFYDVLVMDSNDSNPGLYLADAAGRTLYYFTADTPGSGSTDPVSACTASPCRDNWPVFDAQDDEVPSILDKSDLGEFTRSDGLVQTTYKGGRSTTSSMMRVREIAMVSASMELGSRSTRGPLAGTELTSGRGAATGGRCRPAWGCSPAEGRATRSDWSRRVGQGRMRPDTTLEVR